MMQRYELEAWLGDNHGLNDQQIAELLRTANDIEERYPDPDEDIDERGAALTAAYRVMVGDPDLIFELCRELGEARNAEARALAGMQQAALSLVPGNETESGFARQANVDRMTVRKWLGKR